MFVRLFFTICSFSNNPKFCCWSGNWSLFLFFTLQKPLYNLTHGFLNHIRDSPMLVRNVTNFSGLVYLSLLLFFPVTERSAYVDLLDKILF